MCKTLLPTSILVVIVSVYTYVAIALERRRAIVFPLLPKPSSGRIKIFIAIIWLVPALLMTPLYYHFCKLSLGYFYTLSSSILNGSEETYTRAFVITATVSIFVVPLSKSLKMAKIPTGYNGLANLLQRVEKRQFL